LNTMFSNLAMQRKVPFLPYCAVANRKSHNILKHRVYYLQAVDPQNRIE